MREIYEDPKTGRYKWREKQPASEPPVRISAWLAAVALMADALRVAMESEKWKMQHDYENPVKDEHLRHYQPYRQYMEALEAWKAANADLSDRAGRGGRA